jgi:hypothetical protein
VRWSLDTIPIEISHQTNTPITTAASTTPIAPSETQVARTHRIHAASSSTPTSALVASKVDVSMSAHWT